MRAQGCPVCNKSGKYEGKTCHGCNGKGWVQVPEDRPVMPFSLHHPKPPVRGRPPARSYLGWIGRTGR